MSQFRLDKVDQSAELSEKAAEADLNLPENLPLKRLEPAEYSEASDGLPPGLDFQGSRRCAQCGFLFKYEDLVFFRGRWYGKPCGDASDIQTILRREADGRLRKGEDEDVSHRKASYRGNYTTR